MRGRFETMATIAEAKFGWDELYRNIGYRPARWTALTANRLFERWVIGGSIWLVRTIVDTLARVTSVSQSGIVRQYATVLASGAAVLAVYFLGKANL
jgi:NADH:ubiquinone oxidoreductase subunit 5 (subunit L)/multisubunit Na+/H+ antiporter MnhA subunit